MNLINQSIKAHILPNPISMYIWAPVFVPHIEGTGDPPKNKMQEI